MSDENSNPAKARSSRDDWTLTALFVMVLITILINQTIGVDNLFAKLKDLLGAGMALAITGVWVALAVKLFWPWIRLWMTFVLMVAIVWFWWRVGGY